MIEPSKATVARDTGVSLAAGGTIVRTSFASSFVGKIAAWAHLNACSLKIYEPLHAINAKIAIASGAV